jgi:hypothetical protein
MRKLRVSFERWFSGIGAFLDAAFFKVTLTVSEDMAQRTDRANRDIAACDSLIRKAKYQRHMALAEKAAMDAWTEGRVLGEDHEMIHDPVPSSVS